MKRLFVCLLALMLLLTGCSRETPPQTQQLFAMDTVMDFRADGGGAADALTACAQEINRLEALLSRTRSGSEVSAINEGGAVTVSDETAELLARALSLNAETGGAFDITVAPLVDAWGIQSDHPRVPTAEEIAALLSLVGSSHVHLDGTTVALDDGCGIDLGGIAKGYASDLLAQIYRDYGVEGGWFSLGGNVYAHGTKADGSPWQVAVRDPQNPESAAAMVGLSNVFAVTSGGYQRYFTAEDGTVYQHILDPATGYPVRSDLLSVTIVCTDGTMADAYSTALYVMGLEAATDFWRSHSDQFDMILITADTVYHTPGLTVTVEEGGSYAQTLLS